MSAPLPPDVRHRLMGSLRLAITDMDVAASAAKRLADGEEQSRPVRIALMTGAVVSYARPWTSSHGSAYMFPLDTQAPVELHADLLPDDGEDRDLHDVIIHKLRHKLYAHTDEDAELRYVTGDVAAMVQALGPASLTEGFHELASEGMSQIAALADRQRRRFWTLLVAHGEDELQLERPLLHPEPSLRCAGTCGGDVGAEGRWYSIEPLVNAPFCPACAREMFH